MKKITTILFSLSLVLSLSACIKTTVNPETTTKNITQETTSSEQKTSKTTVTNEDELITDNFVITKVSGTYLEMRKVIYGTDTEKLVYSCNYGDLDGSADMHFNEGDEVTIVYDKNVAETYPLQLTIKEIYPISWN